MDALLSSSLFITICFALCLGVNSQSPQFGDTQTEVYSESGTTAVLPCKVENLGDRQVIWTDKDSRLVSFGDRRVLDDPRMSIERPDAASWNLRIRDVSSSDSGVYTCRVNTNPVLARNVSLDVLSGDPEFVDTDTEVSAAAGQTAVLPCAVKHIGSKTVIWRRSDEPHPLTVGSFTITPGPRYSLLHSTAEGGISFWNLTIRNLAEGDAGSYECSVANKRRHMRKVFQLEVTGPDNDRVSATAGETAVLTCTPGDVASILGVAPVIWRKTENPQPLTVGNMRVTNDERVSVVTDIGGDGAVRYNLNIHHVTPADSGIYECSIAAQNTHTRYSIQLDVTAATTA